jgi:hypothetical protein
MENKGNEPIRDLDNYITATGLEERYPLGFALFYSDGRKTLHYARPANGVQFDPSNVTVEKFTNDSVCLSITPLIIRGSSNWHKNICFTPGERRRMAYWRLGDGAIIYVEPIANSSDGVAWVFGIAPAK